MNKLNSLSVSTMLAMMDYAGYAQEIRELSLAPSSSRIRNPSRKTPATIYNTQEIIDHNEMIDRKKADKRDRQVFRRLQNL